MKIVVLLALLGPIARAEESCWIVEGAAPQGELCKQRLPPCSTFKLPLAVMAIDAGVLDEKTVLKWDHTPQRIKSWETDADARAWLRESMVWFSQRLTPALGLPRIQKYLAELDYGNQDFSGGLTTAWLGSTLKISPEEQVAMLVKLKQGKIHPDAARRAIALLPVDDGVQGKTGSCVDPKLRVGWYVGYAKERAFAYVFKGAPGGPPYAGLEAKKRVLARLSK